MLVDDRRTSKEIAEDPSVIQTLWLIRHGIPFDVAWCLTPTVAKAWAVVLASFEGNEYDWRYDCFKERETT